MVPYYRLDKHLLLPLRRENKWASAFDCWLLHDAERDDDDDKAVLPILSDWLSSLQGKNSKWQVPHTFHSLSKRNMPIVRARLFSGTDDLDTLNEIRKAVRSPNKWMGAPPPKQTGCGRCHFSRKPVFYGSYQDWTSMAEVSPVVSDKIVLASFRPTRDLKIFRLCSAGDMLDLGVVNYPEWVLSAKKNRVYDLVSFQYHLDLWMGFPLKGFKYGHRQYRMRRQVVRCLRRILTIDGIEFNSSQVGGTNLVIFPEDRHHAEFPLQYVTGSVEVCRVTDRPVYAENFRSRSI